MNSSFRIGIISGKLGGVDGVSLEADKWIKVLGECGHKLFTIAGVHNNILRDVPRDNQFEIPKIRFDSNEQKYYERLIFPHFTKDPPYLNRNKKKYLYHELMTEGRTVANEILEYVQKNDIDVLIAENTNAMPMSLLGGIGVYTLATEKRLATIFHHHDFWWERSRFSNSVLDSLLNKIMPPTDLGLEHAVISSYAAHILSSLKRVHPYVIPNCEDFHNPVRIDDYNSDFREEFGFKETDILILQPTRIVRRKRIEDSIELVGRLIHKYPKIAGKVQYIISLYQGDEPDSEYIDEIKYFAASKEVSLHLISDRVASVRGTNAKGQKMYTNRDVLVNSDLVTYLPIWEGFGNALLEAIAAKIPIVNTTYLVYKTDIKVTGIKNIEIRDNYDENGRLVIRDKTLDEIYTLLVNHEKRTEIVEHNFSVAIREFGLDSLKMSLTKILNEYGDEILASRKRIQKSKRIYSV
jgi:mannosylglucosylglycerate synthase